MGKINKVAFFTNEYPPNVYGGAGVGGGALLW